MQPKKSNSSDDSARQSVVAAAAIGALAGLLLWPVQRAIEQFVARPLLCGESEVACGSSLAVSFTVLFIMVLTLTVPLLIRTRVYRPLLVMLAAAVSLWGLQDWLIELPWYEAAFWLALATSLAYAAYAWLARTVTFRWALVAIVLGILTIRLVFVGIA